MPHLTPTEDTVPPEHGIIWVRSDLLPDGTYVAVVHYDNDQSRVLDRQTALAYVAEVFTAAARAEHDAAVVSQLTTIGIQQPVAALSVADLRADRPSLDDAVTAPLRLIPGVSATRGVGFLNIYIGDRLVGQWDPEDARNHAANVLSVLAAVDLDAAYRRYLIGNIRLEPDRAENVVDRLAMHIPGQATDRG